MNHKIAGRILKKVDRDFPNATRFTSYEVHMALLKAAVFDHLVSAGGHSASEMIRLYADVIEKLAQQNVKLLTRRSR